MRYEREKADSIGEKRDEIAAKFKAGKPLSDREALALLLTYTVKKRDTLALAERLLYRFHGFSGVLDAPVSLLVSVPGITLRSAALLKLTPALRSFRYGSVIPMNQKRSRGKENVGKKAALTSRTLRRDPPSNRTSRSGIPETGNEQLDEALRRMRSCFSGESSETAGVLLIDGKGTPVSFCRIGKGENGVLTSDMRTFVRELLRSGAESVIVAHNHPCGPALSSDADLLASEQIFSVLKCFGIETAGYVIYGKNRCLFLSPQELSAGGRNKG